MPSKAQMTFELMIYMAIGVSALVVSLYAIVPIRDSYNSNMSKSELYAALNIMSQMQQYGSSSFQAYVPKSICSCKATGNGLDCSYGYFSTGMHVELSKNVCLDSGGIENLSEYYLGNGSYRIGES